MGALRRASCTISHFHYALVTNLNNGASLWGSRIAADFKQQSRWPPRRHTQAMQRPDVVASAARRSGIGAPERGSAERAWSSESN